MLLKDLQDEDIVRTATKPKELLDVALNDGKNGGRDSALLLTKEDIINLKRYERYGMGLPKTLQTVKELLGINASGIPGLEPQDILNTHQAINQHAASWFPIEMNIKLAGVNIDTFASDITNQGNRIIKYIDDMELMAQLTMTVGQLSDDFIQKMIPAKLSAKDTAVKSALSTYLSLLAKGIDERRVMAVQLRDQLITFNMTMQNTLIPSVSQKLTLVKNSNLEQQIKELSKDIDRLTKDIEQLNKDYSAALKNIAKGAMFGPLGVVISGGIYGSKAEQVRKEKNRLVNEKNAKVREIKIKQPISAAVRGMGVRFEDMQIRLEDAVQSATNLQDLWTVISAYIENSAKKLAEIEDTQTLLVFALQFQSVITPWNEIRGYTSRLIQIFDSALEEFKREAAQGNDHE